MKQVLWLASWYPNSLDKFDGDFIQRHAAATAILCRVHVIYVKKDERLIAGEIATEIQENKNLTEELFYYNSTKTGIKLLDRFLSQRKANKIYKAAVRQYIAVSGKPDLVHVHIAMKAGITARWIKKKWNIPFVVTEHWTGYYRQSIPSLYQQDRFIRNLNRVILKEAAMVMPVTEDLGKTIKQNFIDVPYQVVPNVVNTDLFYYKPYTPEKFRFVHFSYMNYQKNPEGILAAANSVREMGYDFELFMIGNDEKRLTDLAAGYSLLNEVVVFKAAVSYDEVARQMQQASALILFSRFENLPCVVLEALCCGLPVISTDVGGISEVVSKENGILVENEKVSQLADAMQQLIENYNRYNKKAIADKAREHFNYATVGNLYFNSYCAVLKSE